MSAATKRLLVTSVIAAMAAHGVTACTGDAGAPAAPAETGAVPAVTYDDVGSLSVASNFAVLGEFIGYVDPERGIFEVRMVDDLDEAGAVADELREAHQRTTVSDPTGWCRATVDRDGTAGTGATNTVEFYTPWGEIDKSIDECLTRIGDDGLSETSFPNGVLCADVIIRSFFTSDLENVYAEITSHNGESNQYGYAFPLGNGAERPDFGRNRPGLDFGLWSYGNLTTDSPEKKVVWTFKFGSTTPFTFGGRVIYSVAEDCDNGTDDDCDGIADNACNEFLEGTTCIINDDCAGDSFCDGGALDSGAGDVDGACTCNTVDPPYHDSACSATCGDGTKNGAEEDIDCGGPCDPCPPVKIIGGDTAPRDLFGRAVSIDGARAIVGSIFATVASSDAGAAYVFERQTDGSWTQGAKLTASDASGGDWFGTSVSLDGDRALVGAKFANGAGSDRGAAYIFERQTDGSWTQVAKLTASDAADGDNFGESVSLTGDHTIVGAFHADPGATDAGSAYIFERQSDGSWAEAAKLTLPSPAMTDYFGTAVSITGRRAIVGAPGTGAGEGSVHAFERQTDGSWTQVATLTASDAAAADSFGESASLDGDRALIGAFANDDGGTDSGSAYIFERQSDGSWAEAQKLVASDAAADDRFGFSVSLDGGRAVVGAHRDDDAGTSSGSAYIFERQGDGSWTQASKATAHDAASGDEFGWAVSLSGSHALIAAPMDGHIMGAAYIFEL